MAVLAAIIVLSGSDDGSGDGGAGKSGVARSAGERPIRPEPDEAPAVPGDDEPQPREVVTAGDRDFACDPYPDDVPSEEGLAALLERHQRESQRRARVLEGSEDVALRLAAALITDKRSPEYLQRLLSVLALDPDNPLILERLLEACINRPESRVCEERGIVERAAEADGDNGEMWGAIAGYRASRGNTDGALQALRRGASAGTHREYFADVVRVIELGLAASAGSLSYVERVIEGIGWAAASTSPWLTAYSACRERVAADPLWRDACLDFARHLEERSQTVLNRAIGISLQAMIAEESGDEAGLAAVREREREYRNWRDEHLTTDGQIVLMGDERVLRQYLDEFDAHGELASLEYLREEVERLKRLPGYDPCPAVIPPPGQ